MRKVAVFIILGGLTLAGQNDPITDKERLEIARAQRDLLLADAKMKEAVERFNAAKAEADGLQKALGERVAAAAKACGSHKTFDTAKLVCVDVPAPTGTH